MHLRKLVLACGIMSLALSNYASALGLGEVKLKSTLNEPLSAEIQLLDTRDLTSEQVKIALASPADFERNGVERLYFYTEFQFEVALDNPGGPVVRVTSRSPVREPYLNFLIEARWTAGRLLREYTLLMDLPTFDDKAPPKAVQSAETTKSKPVVSTPKPKANTTVTPEGTSSYTEEKPAIIAEQDQTAKKSKVAAGTYGPIESKDTLWEIARAVRPDSSVSIHQTMLALQRLNPDVFIRNNINLIKKGHVLRIPDSAEIASVSQRDAVREVNSQITQWNEWSGTSTASTGLGAQLDASHHTTGDRRQTEPVAGRVKLEAPSSSNTAGSGQGSGANRGMGKALESELASTLEELDKAKSEKTELSSRVHDLEDQVKTMQRLVDVSNEKLRSMQLNATKQTEKVVEKTPAPVIEKPAEIKAPEVATPAPVITPAPETAQVSSAAEASSMAAEVSSVAPVKKPVARPVVTKPAEKSLVDQLMDNIQYIAGGLLVLIIGAFLLMRRKKSQATAAAETYDSDDLFASEPNFDHFQEPEELPEEEEPVEDMASLYDEEEEAAAVAETGDVVGEADIYIAYGKFDQAEEMLLNGLAKDPSSTDIRLKLLEVYSQTQNVSEFDKHYAAILPFATGFALARASELRANIAGAGEFADTDSVHAFNAKHSSFDDIDDTDLSTPPVAPPPPVRKPEPEPELSFDLDLGEDDASVTRQRPAIKSPPEEEFNLDFDLDDVGEPESHAEDLSDISLALDELSDNTLDDDLEVTTSDDDFNFDEFEAAHPTPAAKVETHKEPEITAEDLDFGDDFDLDMDADDDHGMKDLDEDLKAFEKPAAKPVQDTKSTSTQEAKIDDSFTADQDDDLAWMEDDDEAGTFEISADEFNVDNDDFDLDVADSDLEDLDASFAELDDKPAAKPAAPAPAAKAPAPKPSVSDEIDDDVFEQAMSDFSSDNLNAGDMSEDDMDAELDFMADADEAATKLDLARAYIDMGDGEGARDILTEVAHEGNEQQRREATELLSRIDA